MYNFDDVINRKGTHCEKWDGLEETFGSPDILPFWVADMDFRIAPEIHAALSNVLDHGVLGYPMMHIGAKKAVAHWQAHRHQWDVPADAVRFVPGVITGLIVAIHAFTKPGDAIMSPREAIRILMLSPIYFRLNPTQRWQLVREFCRRFNALKT